ncbi:MAG: hypothetical protein ACD_23C01110G0001, partial [uncultured bacterium]
LGARVIGPELAKTIVDHFLASHFSGGNSAKKVDAITDYERQRNNPSDSADAPQA